MLEVSANGSHISWYLRVEVMLKSMLIKLNFSNKVAGFSRTLLHYHICRLLQTKIAAQFHSTLQNILKEKFWSNSCWKISGGLALLWPIPARDHLCSTGGRTACLSFFIVLDWSICSQSTWKLWKKKISHSAKWPWSLDCCRFIFCMSSAKDSLNDIVLISITMLQWNNKFPRTAIRNE